MMKKKLILSLLLSLIYLPCVFSQQAKDTTVYLLTCGPGTETYSIYGHSALRVVIPEKNSDVVYNWGVFAFNTPNFAWNFAKGRLAYNLGDEQTRPFLEFYFYEQRYVHEQEINLSSKETYILLSLINENLKPENRSYRYDFFYDDCSTRIRDLLEKSIGERLLYPPVETEKLPTFREMVGKYQAQYPWLNFGINLIMGAPGDKTAVYRDRMFLPLDLKKEMSQAVVNRTGKMIPLLQNPEILIDFEAPVVKKNFLISPVVVFTLLLIIILIISARIKSMKANNILDLFVFFVFSVLALLMIFFNFFTDHQQMKLNLNILWLNPFILICLLSLILKVRRTFWFRIVFYISAIFLVVHFILPQSFDMAIIPLVLILLIRSSVRGDFDWNPINLEHS
jgi:hypothetical protein